MRILRATYRPGALAALSQVPEVKKQVRAVAVAVRNDARPGAPVRTGNLRRGLVVVNVFDLQTRMVKYRVGWRMDIAWYGGIVETKQPHLRPAAWKHGAKIRIRGR